MRAAFTLLALAAVATADRSLWDCKMRQLGLDFAQKLQPFRDIVRAHARRKVAAFRVCVVGFTLSCA